MTLVDRVIPFGWFDVGVTPNASAMYPIISVVETHETQGTDGDNTATTLRTTMTFESFTRAVGAETTNQVMDRLRAELTRRGAQVRVNEMNGAARVFKVGGAAAGALPGYPRVRLDTIPDGSIPPIQRFRVTVETIEPIEANLPFHTFDRTTAIDAEGLTIITQRGSVRVDSVSDPVAWLTSNVITPAQSAAQALGRLFSSKYTLGADPSIVTYDYTDAAPGAVAFGPNVTNAQVTDETRTERVGRVTRTISGFAEGPGASSFAVAQDPTSPSVFVTRKSVSAPQTPTGRVSFRYESLAGSTLAIFPGLFVFDWSQRVEFVGGGKAVQSAAFDTTSPRLWLGAEEPYLYRESSQLIFRGAWTDASIPFALSQINLAGPSRESRESRGGGVNELRVDRSYIFSAAQTLPAPTEVSAL